MSLPAPRRLVWLSEDVDRELAVWRERCAGRDLWWYGTEPPEGTRAIAATEARRELGGECDLLVFDARHGFDADAFGALSGTVRGGGILVLVTPPPALWDGAPFVRRLERVLRAHTGAPLTAPPSHSRSPPSDTDPSAATADQAAAVAALLRVACGHRRRPLVLTADRGRGKSAALGIAAARLLQQGRGPVVVTAPRPGATARLFDQVARLLGTRQPGGLAFVPPDELVRHPRPANLVLVDEAAGVPVPLLERLLRAHARIAFATTVHGYEGTGRGFAVRFRAALDQATPGWRELVLRAPIRWPEGDPLERFTFEALALDAAPAADRSVGAAAPDNCAFEPIAPDELLDDERLLRELFGLLVLSHYRTRPSDLQRLLDAREETLWVARHRGHVVAAAIVVREGGLSQALAGAVASGQRRVPGHLLAQALALHEGASEAARLCYARIMRIAVHPAARGRGLGRALVEALAGGIGSVDFLGTSFGATPDLLAFWEGLGMRPVRLGAQRDAASGAHSAMLLRALTPRGEVLFGRLRRRFFERFPFQLSDGFEELDADLVAVLAADAPAPLPGEDDADDLAAFAAGRRDYACALPALWRGTWRALAAGGGRHFAPRVREALVRRVLQKRPWGEVAAALGVPGRGGVEALLREAAQDLAGDPGNP